MEHTEDAFSSQSKLDKSNFDNLANVLYHECNWEPWEIESRLKHDDEIDDHDWS